MRPLLPAPLALALVLSPALEAPAQEPQVPTFGATTELVYVRFHVEKKGAYVSKLAPEQVRVTEDGQPQKIVLLETPQTRERTVPPEVTLALDVSSSVLDPQLLDEALVKDVLFASLDANARVGLCAFGGELRCPTKPTRHAPDVIMGFREALDFGYRNRNQGSRIYDSVVDMVREQPAGERAQRALVVFSDGIDNRGGDVDKAIRAAQEADVRVYSITLSQAYQDAGGNPFGAPRNRAQFDYKKLDLTELAESTGARNWEPGTLDGKTLASILKEIATEISMENVVGYEPQGEATGKRRRIKVELVDKSLGKVRNGERTLVR
jgi:VWFA-related protein